MKVKYYEIGLIDNGANAEASEACRDILAKAKPAASSLDLPSATAVARVLNALAGNAASGESLPRFVPLVSEIREE